MLSYGAFYSAWILTFSCAEVVVWKGEKAKEDTFNFFLEGTGVLRPGRIVLHTFKILLSKLDSIKVIYFLMK